MSFLWEFGWDQVKSIYNQEKCKIIVHCVTSMHKNVTDRNRKVTESVQVGDTVFIEGPTGKQKKVLEDKKFLRNA
jgi:hypothetical protein